MKSAKMSKITDIEPKTLIRPKKQAQIGTLWHTLAHFGTDWHTLAHFGTERHRLAQKGTTLHRKEEHNNGSTRTKK
jgi:hypothetical protein